MLARLCHSSQLVSRLAVTFDRCMSLTGYPVTGHWLPAFANVLYRSSFGGSANLSAVALA